MEVGEACVGMASTGRRQRALVPRSERSRLTGAMRAPRAPRGAAPHASATHVQASRAPGKPSSGTNVGSGGMVWEAWLPTAMVHAAGARKWSARAASV